MILTLSGASGVGKSTAILSLLNRSRRYRRLSSYTTRASRSDDRPGEIIHVANSVFDELSHSGKFIWEVSVFGSRYGSLRSELEAALTEKETIVLCDVASSAIEHLTLLTANTTMLNRSLRKIYLSAPGQFELERRLRQRGVAEDQIALRMSKMKEIETRELISGKYDVIVSSSLKADEVADIVHSISGAEKF